MEQLPKTDRQKLYLFFIKTEKMNLPRFTGHQDKTII